MRSEFLPEQPRLPIYINNFNRLTMPKKMLEWLERIPYAEVVFIDNASTYPPLLDWYSRSMVKLVRLPGNFGHMAFFMPYRIPIHYGANDCLNTRIRRSLFNLAPEWFVLTDPDVLPDENCPLDLLEVMHSLMIQFTDKQKIGIGLRVDDLPDCYPLKANVVKWETSLLGRQLAPLAVEAPVDTTFALYKKDRWHLENPIRNSMRTTAPYMARHLPWYINTERLDEEEEYYMTRATGASSYVTTIKHNKEKAMENSGGSCLPVLLACVKATKGAVLEIGLGDHSTPALHELCSNRLLMSVEKDANWLKRFESLFGGMHKYTLIFNWNDPWYFWSWNWDVAYIDAEAVEARTVIMERLADKARFIVVHDTENSGYEAALSKFKFRYDCKKFTPNTSVVSNFSDPNEEFKGLLP